MPNTNQKPDGAISLFEAARLTGYHQDYLGQLCRAGKIQATKVGRVWYTTEQAVRSYFQASAVEPEQAPTVARAADEELPIELPEADEDQTEQHPNIDLLIALREKRDQQLFRKMHMRPALLTTLAALIAIAVTGALLFVSDDFLGKPNQTQVMNYDARPSSFKDKSVAGAVDEPVPKVLIYPAPHLDSSQGTSQNVLY